MYLSNGNKNKNKNENENEDKNKVKVTRSEEGGRGEKSRIWRDESCSNVVVPMWMRLGPMNEEKGRKEVVGEVRPETN